MIRAASASSPSTSSSGAEKTWRRLPTSCLIGVSETLRSGDFALVVAAPTIPEGVERVMEYLNARGLALYGFEVSYFKGEIEAFVPRIVIRPTVSTVIAGRDSQAASKAAVDPETNRAARGGRGAGRRLYRRHPRVRR